jgi:hypothetical protein
LPLNPNAKRFHEVSNATQALLAKAIRVKERTESKTSDAKTMLYQAIGLERIKQGEELLNYMWLHSNAAVSLSWDTISKYTIYYI